MKKTPVNIITGFLGAGKTTAIIQLLQSKNEAEKWAVIVNEFGKVSIDYELLSPVAANESVFEISGGCICCSAKDHFLENIKEIAAQNIFDRILIEPSGLGGAEMVAEQVRQIQNLELMPVICLTAVDWFEQDRIQRNMIYQSQLHKSQIVVLSKCDTIKSHIELQSILERVKLKYPDKLHYHLSSNGTIPFAFLQKNQIAQNSNSFFIDTGLSSDSSYRQDVFSFEKSKVFNPDLLLNFFEKETKIIRAKGFIRTSEGWFNIHSTFTQTSLRACDEKTENQMVIIQDKAKSLSVLSLNRVFNDMIV